MQGLNPMLHMYNNPMLHMYNNILPLLIYIRISQIVLIATQQVFLTCKISISRTATWGSQCYDEEIFMVSIIGFSSRSSLEWQVGSFNRMTSVTLVMSYPSCCQKGRFCHYLCSSSYLLKTLMLFCILVDNWLMFGRVGMVN